MIRGFLDGLASRIPMLRHLLERRSARRLLDAAVALAAAAHDRGERPSVPAGCLISFVVPVYNSPPAYLNALLKAFRREASIFPACELVFSDDGSSSPATGDWLDRHVGQPGLTVIRHARNRGIAAATNDGIAAAKGEWVALHDHDDALSPYAVERMALALQEHPECQFLYTDEVIADARLRPAGYFLKPAFDDVLLSGVNYINHLSIYRRQRLVALGGLREGFSGSQDYDLVLRYTVGLRPEERLHLPYPAYIWRRDGQSYSVQFLEQATNNARAALGERYATADGPALVEKAGNTDLHRVRFDTQRQDWPKVSVVIPSRDRIDLIERVLDGLMKTDYPEMEIIVVDNGSTDPEVLSLYQRMANGPCSFRADVQAEPFNFSRSINRGVALAQGDHILLLNNDIEVISPDWLKEMVSCMAYERTGIVGARLLYPDGSLQHSGVIVGFGGLAGHWYVGEPADCPGPMGRLRVRQSFSAVTGACMLVSRACLTAVGPLDEIKFAIAYNDVDFCLRAIKAGFRIVWTPFATLFHHESATRGSDVTPDKIERFHTEQGHLRARHHTDRYEDPAINPWYTKHRSDPAIVNLTHLPPAR